MTSSTRRRRGAAWAFAAYLVLLAVVLLDPSASFATALVASAEERAAARGAPDVLLESGRVEFVFNVIALVPVSALGSLVWPRWNWRDWTAVGFLIASGVEAAQAVIVEPRSATFVDIVANTLGACLGGVVVAVLRRGGEPGA